MDYKVSQVYYAVVVEVGALGSGRSAELGYEIVVVQVVYDEVEIGVAGGGRLADYSKNLTAKRDDVNVAGCVLGKGGDVLHRTDVGRELGRPIGKLRQADSVVAERPDSIGHVVGEEVVSLDVGDRSAIDISAGD